MSAPKIVGGISEFSTSVRLRGQIVDALVTVLRNGEVIAEDRATHFDQVFDFFPGTILAAGDRITTRQEFNGFTSSESPIPTQVQNRVPPHDGQQFVSHIYACGQSLFLAGLVPGAEVRLDAGGQSRGFRKSVDGGAVVVLTSPTGNGEQLNAVQWVGGSPGPTVTGAAAEPPPPLNQFTVDPLLECQISMSLHHAVDGATIRLRSDASDPATERTVNVPIPDYTFSMSPFSTGQELLVQESMLRCEIKSEKLNPVVASVSFDLPPVIRGPLCAGTRLIEVNDVLIGAVLTAKQGPTVVGLLAAYDTSVQMWIEPLSNNGQPVVITESLCSATIDSAPVSVTPLSTSVGPCHIQEPLIECGMSLWLANAYPGSTVVAFSDQIGPLCEPIRISQVDPMLTLHTPLVEGHQIWVEQSVCGGAMEQSDNAPVVQSLPPLDAPFLDDPVFMDQATVRAHGAQPGARVQLYEQEQGFVSEAIANAQGDADLPTHGARDLQAGWFVHVRQLLCNDISGFSEPVVEVKDRTPPWYANLHRLGQTGFYADSEPVVTGGVFRFPVDNPTLFSILPLREEYAEWSGSSVPQEAERNGLTWASYNTKIQAIDAPPPVPARGTDLSAIEVPPEKQGHWTAPDVLPVQASGICLGYAPSTFAIRVSKPHEGQTSSIVSPPPLALDSNTLLVPVEIGYFFHDATLDGQPQIPKNPRASSGSMRLLFDNMPDLDVNGLWSATWPPGEVKTSQRAVLQDFIFNGQDRQGRRTPDSVFRPASLAFRVARYFEFGVPRNRTLPHSGDFLSDHSAFNLNKNDWPNGLDHTLRVLIMENVAPPESLIDGVGGPGIAGLSARSTFGDSLCHEIGHAAGIGGHSADPNNLMYEISGTGYDINAAQIVTLRNWATGLQVFWQ